MAQAESKEEVQTKEESLDDEEEEPTKRTRSGRRSKRPAAFKETLEFSSGSDTERGGRRRRKRRKSNDSPVKRSERSVGEYPVDMNISVKVSRQEVSKGFPLILVWDQQRRRVVVSKVNPTPNMKRSSFSRIRVGDELLSVNDKAVESAFFNENTDVSTEVQKLLVNRKTSVMKFGARRIVRARLATLKYDVIQPQELYDSVEELGGKEWFMSASQAYQCMKVWSTCEAKCCGKR